MNTIKKVSEIAPIDVADYLRITIIDGDDQRMLTNLIEVSKSFIKSYTGLTEEELDNYSDFIIVVLILCQDMWDNRTLYIDKSNLNNVVDTILGMHCRNLL